MSRSRFSAGTVAGVVWGVLRILYAAWFLFFAGFMLVAFHGHVPGSFGPHADPFLAALNAVGFVEPLLIAVYLAGGGTLLFRRTAPLGLILLAGPVVMIVAFHWLHTGLIAWGSIWAVGLVLLAWRFRDGFRPLWNFPSLNLGAASPPPAIKGRSAS